MLESPSEIRKTLLENARRMKALSEEARRIREILREGDIGITVNVTTPGVAPPLKIPSGAPGAGD
jgi:hypothetical protein